MAEDTKVAGIKTKFMEKEYLNGLIIDTMKAITIWIKRKVLANLFGRMGDHI